MVDTLIDWSVNHTVRFKSASVGFRDDMSFDAGPTAVVASVDGMHMCTIARSPALL